MSAALSLDSRLVATADHLSSDFSGEVVILSLSDGVYYGLDAVGAQIWRLLAEPRTVRDLVAGVMSHYTVDGAQCERDVLAFLEDLRSHDLVAATESAPG
ncbi:MAG TPA: PqqD family peptide modification chaperone [Gemmatimonadaceae bacterium]